jgi:dolichol-phosphate mannosyltransferase
MLGIDADTQPHAALVDSVVAAARAADLDVVSFAPRFTGQSAGERWLQPAMLLSLVYRTGAAGATASPDRVLANGQCFLARRTVLLEHGGYSSARASFSDDVTLARHLARQGARVGFRDGSRIIGVRSYASMRETWREWGRSFDLSDSSTRSRQWLDVLVGWSVQALPLPLLALSLLMLSRGEASNAWMSLAITNGIAFLIRLLMLFALRESYAKRGLPFWMSFTADIPAVVRLTMSTVRRPRRWRGREYATVA